MDRSATAGPTGTLRAGSSKPSSNRIAGADGLRALAALAVFVCHIARLGPAVPNPWPFTYRLMDRGALGVAVFFVLSGFLLSQPFWKAYHARKPLPSLRVYGLRRVARIVPAYYLNILILALLAGTLATRWGWFETFTTLTFTSSLFSATYCPSFNGVLWSIGIEFLFYILLPIFAVGLWFFGRHSVQRAWVYTLSVIALILIAQAGLLHLAPKLQQIVNSPPLLSATGWNMTRNAVILFTQFLVGVLTAEVFLRWCMPRLAGSTGTKWFNRFDLIALLLLAGLVLIPVNSATQGPELGLAMVDYDWPTYHLLVAALLLVVPFSGIVAGFLDHAFLRYTADVSYGIYIWHAPILELLRRHWPENTLSPAVQQLIFAAIGLAATYAAASASYFWLEKPVLKWAHRRTTYATSTAVDAEKRRYSEGPDHATSLPAQGSKASVLTEEAS